MRIYVAGPLTNPDPEQRLANVTAAMDAGIGLYLKGHTPFIPHLTHFVDVRQQEIGAGLFYMDWMRADIEWLRMCDAILFLGSSPGADEEMNTAQSLGLLTYRSLHDVPLAWTKRKEAPTEAVAF